jgi:hypothetical protein
MATPKKSPTRRTPGFKTWIVDVFDMVSRFSPPHS